MSVDRQQQQGDLGGVRLRPENSRNVSFRPDSATVQHVPFESSSDATHLLETDGQVSFISFHQGCILVIFYIDLYVYFFYPCSVCYIHLQ